MCPSDTHRRARHLLASLALLATPALAAREPVMVSDAWARATAPGQKVAAAYMKLEAREPLRLEGVSSPAARSAELHEMWREGDVMRMRSQPGLDLPAGQPVDLKPGGLHVMLFGLRKPLEPGQRLALHLRLRKAGGKVLRQTVDLPVRPVDDTAQNDHR